MKASFGSAPSPNAHLDKAKGERISQNELALAQIEERRALQDELHTRYGYRLFAEGDFDDAMAHFGMCSNANPLVLLNLFPSLAPPQLLLPLEETIAGTL